MDTSNSMRSYFLVSRDISSNRMDTKLEPQLYKNKCSHHFWRVSEKALAPILWAL